MSKRSSTSENNWFYHTVAWKSFADYIRKSRHYICENCGAPGHIVHHKIHLTPKNIHDYSISLDETNVMLLCSKCHENQHDRQKKRHTEERRIYTYDDDGNIISIVDNPLWKDKEKKHT